jgi:hypothetical protein
VTCSRRKTLADCKLGVEEERLMRDISDAVSTIDEPVSRGEVARMQLAYLVTRHGKAGALDFIRKRLAVGQEQYGLLQQNIWDGKRDFNDEFDQEGADQIVYDWSEWRREGGRDG